ncbi:SusC/RagA family TonB-linked outer membrane protein [Pedobacter sp. AW31-3R]|uniref:SusC/RagA family TonB-linked outer membrane protein n=1 Tax=Pedobacter sp. AW31-3R TaxID=3445781 RepID=UPI003FA128F4
MRNNYRQYLLFLILISLAFNMTGNAQINSQANKPVSLNFGSASLVDVLRSIEKQTGSNFNYDQSEIDTKQRVSIRSKSTLQEALNALSNELNIDFNIAGATISIRRSAKRTAANFRLITGVVNEEETGRPIPGVNIYKKGTRQGAVTNHKGEFTYKLNGDHIDDVVLVFNYIGMKPQEVRLGKQSYLTINLKNDVFGMDEVVVTGSYTKDKRREEVVGSISQVTAQQLQIERPIESFDKMLEGLVAGVYVETNTELNTPVKINIRGQGSLISILGGRTSSSQPLYVIDGIPVYEQQRANESSVFNGEDYLNPLSNINPDDIQSISVLKDATASSLYGANAANGVIIITTKKGTAGRTDINFNYDTGVATFINEFKWLSGNEYYRLLREAYINGGTSATNASQLAGSSTTNTDWLDLTTRNATYQNAGLNISGGSDKTTFRFSTGYRDQQSSGVANDLQKFYLRFNMNHEVNEKFKIGFNVSPTYTTSSTLSNYGDVALPPNLSPYQADGSYTDFLGVPNPMAVLAQNENKNKGLEVMAQLNATYKLNKEISFFGVVGADSYQNRQTQYASGLNATGATLNGNLRIYDRNRLGYTSFLQGTYDKTFNEKHTLNFLLGTQIENSETNLLRGSGTGFTYDRLRVLSAASVKSSASSNTSSATVSYYSQLGYDLNKKYYANVNARIDKSSIFGGDSQVAFNGSLGLGWIISKEDFLKDNKTLTFLRLRTTYGSTGNSRIGNYSARGLYTFGTASGSSYAGNVSSYVDDMASPNPDLSWEKNLKLNFGLDFNLFDKVQVTAEYYQNTIKDMISSVYVPQEIGFTRISANASTMRNKGFELSITASPVRTKNFNWDISYNLGTNKNRIISFNEGYTSLFSTATDAAGLKEGNSTTAIYGYEWAGVDPLTGAEQFYGPDGTVMTASQVNSLPITSTAVLGDRLPDFQGGMVNSFSLKNFSLSFNVIYSYGADALVSYVDQSDGRNLQNRNQSVNLLDRWQRPGDITGVPKLMINRTIVSNSSRYLYDASYFKLSNVSFKYSLTEKLASRLHLSRATVFVNGTNLFYVYKDAGTKGRNGIAEHRFTTPESMAFTAGIKIGL